MRNTWWNSGNWNAICDVCGFKFKATDLKQRWDGLMVDSACWEMRHPQELIRPIPDQNKLPWTRPESTDTFTSVTYVNTVSPDDLPVLPPVILTSGDLETSFVATFGTLPIGPATVVFVVPDGTTIDTVTVGTSWTTGMNFVIRVLGTLTNPVDFGSYTGIVYGGPTQIIYSLDAEDTGGGAGYDLFGLIGSLSPDTYSIYVINAITSSASVGGSCNIQMIGIPPQSIFTSITINDTTLFSSDADFQDVGGAMDWTWTGTSFYGSSPGIYTVTFT